jgi:hypothetical protein
MYFFVRELFAKTQSNVPATDEDNTLVICTEDVLRNGSYFLKVILLSVKAEICKFHFMLTVTFLIETQTLFYHFQHDAA